MLGKIPEIEQALGQVKEYSNKIGFEDEKTLLSLVEAVINNEIWEVSYSQTFSDVVEIEPSDIPSSLGDESSVYFMQDAVTVTGTRKTATLSTFNGDEESYTFIHKDVEANEEIDGASIYEIVPVSLDDLIIESRVAVTKGNLVEYPLTLSRGESVDYYYLSPQSLNLGDFSTIVVLPEVEEVVVEEKEEPLTVCGDGICSVPIEDENSCPVDCKKSFPVVLVVVVTLLALLLLVVINLVGKKRKNSLAVAPPSTNPIESLTEYVKKELQKKVPEQKIVFSLKQRGWREDQISQALEKAKAVLSTPKPAPSLTPKKEEKPKGKQPLFKK